MIDSYCVYPRKEHGLLALGIPVEISNLGLTWKDWRFIAWYRAELENSQILLDAESADRQRSDRSAGAVAVDPMNVRDLPF